MNCASCHRRCDAWICSTCAFTSYSVRSDDRPSVSATKVGRSQRIRVDQAAAHDQIVALQAAVDGYGSWRSCEARELDAMRARREAIRITALRRQHSDVGMSRAELSRIADPALSERGRRGGRAKSLRTPRPAIRHRFLLGGYPIATPPVPARHLTSEMERPYNKSMTNTNTAAAVTTSQIKALRTEALAAGDDAQELLCSIALADHETANDDGTPFVDFRGHTITRTQARAACAKAIADATAQEDNYGTLTDYKTGETIRPATLDELRRSENAGPTGVFIVDGRSCFVA